MPLGHASGPSLAAQAASLHETPPPEPPRRIWVVPGLVAAILAAALIGYAILPWSSILAWAAQEQRAFQDMMAGALRAIRGGDRIAILALCGATAAYGFVHALGPGHGKVLLGGAALASRATIRRMAVLTLLSSLGQAVSAILLVLLATALFGWATRDLIGWTEAALAPASAIAIAGIGLWLMVRGLRAYGHARLDWKASGSAGCACGHSHGPTIFQVQTLESRRDALAIVLSIAMRPCTGALFLLVIALRFDIFAVGCLAVLAMSLGTAGFNLVIATSGVLARRVTAHPLDSLSFQRLSAILHIVCGALIATASLALAKTYLDSPALLP